MVMGDVNLDGLKVVAGEIKKKGGSVPELIALVPLPPPAGLGADRILAHFHGASMIILRKCVFIKCDVTKWEDQVAMFELATKT